MPFTLSHCIVAIPLAKLSAHRIPFASIAIGSMTPDLYRLFSSQSGQLSHQWTGLIYPNFFIGILFCLLWYLLYKPILSNFIESKNDRPFLQTNKSLQLFFISIGLILGCITHLIWDGFTHLDYRTLFFHQALSQNISFFGKSYSLHFLLQISSSILGLLVLFYFVYKNFKFKKISQHTQIATIYILIISILFSCFYAWISLQNITQIMLENNSYYYLGRIINKIMSGILISSSLLFFTIKLTGLKINK